ncbi:RnfABCDGE type electron transport complex subunit A [Candidatus Aerophobetes bacterium]|nr:RnfABCDGE type electron transport complex subunit A [Candidatus Aerophobetes bacterium]
MKMILLFLSAALVNNFVLRYFLGICPFLGVTGKVESAITMGFATTFVMTLTAIIIWPINHFILVDLPFLKYVTIILVIASLVQLIEMFIRKTSPVLYRALGIYLPLITTNCSIFFLALFITEPLRDYSFVESIIFGFGAGLGFTLVMLIMAGIREQLDFADVPKPLQGASITLITAGLLALAFMGFTGLIGS